MERSLMVDKEAVYAECIAPLVQRIYDLCKEHEIPSIVLIECSRKETDENRTQCRYNFTATAVLQNPIIHKLATEINSLNDAE